MATPQTPPVAPPPMLPSGSRVVLVVSKGPASQAPSAFVDVPGLVGSTQGDALSALQDADLTARVFNDYSDGVPRGRVMGQLPQAGVTAPAGTEVVLLVSSGPAVSHTSRVILPDVVGKAESDAVAAVQSANLSPQVSSQHSQAVPAGTVIAQLPNAATLAEQPAAKQSRLAWIVTVVLMVTLVAVGFFVFGGGRKVAAPDVVGMSQADAATAIADAGLTLGSVTETESADVAEGTVVSQDPAAGVLARKGSRVDLVIAGGAPLVTVPDVTGASEKRASAELSHAGLKVEVTLEPNADVAKGEVVRQTPAAGEQVPSGTTVGIVVSQGAADESVTLPKVEGMSQTEASDLLEAQGLVVVVVENPSPDAEAGAVIGQLPGPGERVAPGSTVAISVSSGAPEDASTVAVPQLVGEKLADAKATLTDVGLGVQAIRVSGSGEPADTVTAQMPAGGAAASPGTTVVVFYSDGK